MGKALDIVVGLLLAAPSVLPVHAQSMASANSADRDPFATLHAELDRAADTALADTVQRMADAASDDSRPARSRSPESLLQDFDERYRPTTKLGPSAAINRLDQLRPVVEPILQSEGIPVELSSVIVVESGGRPNALSPRGALGLWQLMPDTARRYGLVVDQHRDERLDVERSTHAAARYLRDLYQQFGSWPLALAGYNAGEQVLQRAMDRAGSSDFLQLSRLRFLPQETRNYVPAVLSAMQLSGSRDLPIAPMLHRKLATSEVFAVSDARP
jgi:hypothetical protein